jgi:hypothetical protein
VVLNWRKGTEERCLLDMAVIDGSGDFTTVWV